jgi:hypothetical protein
MFSVVEYLMKSCKTLKGGLQDVADDLEVCLDIFLALFSLPLTT